jgi:hypothetical protein
MDEETDFAFLQACSDGDYPIVEHLLNEVSDIDVRDDENDGETGLYHACKNGRIHIVELLLQSGADVDAGDYNRVSPLIIATQTNHVDIAEMLMDAGADLDIRSTDGTAAIHIAALYNRTEIAKDLIEHRANINLKTSDGETAVFIALDAGHRVMAKLLLNMGAKVSQVEYNAATVPIQRFFDNWKKLQNTRKVRTVLKKTPFQLPPEIEGQIASFVSGTTGKLGVRHGPMREGHATNYVGDQELELEDKMAGGTKRSKRSRQSRKRSRQSRS